MKISENYMLTEINEKPVALPVGQNVADMSKILSLNPVAAFICECLREELSLEELRSRLYEKYKVEESEKAIINKDIDEFLNYAVTKGLILK